MAKLILSAICLASCVMVAQAQTNIKNTYSSTGVQTPGTVTGTCDTTKVGLQPPHTRFPLPIDRHVACGLLCAVMICSCCACRMMT